MSNWLERGNYLIFEIVVFIYSWLFKLHSVIDKAIHTCIHTHHRQTSSQVYAVGDARLPRATPLTNVWQPLRTQSAPCCHLSVACSESTLMPSARNEMKTIFTLVVKDFLSVLTWPFVVRFIKRLGRKFLFLNTKYICLCISDRLPINYFFSKLYYEPYFAF